MRKPLTGGSRLDADPPTRGSNLHAETHFRRVVTRYDKLAANFASAVALAAVVAFWC